MGCREPNQTKRREWLGFMCLTQTRGFLALVDEWDCEWQRKGATLSDRTAREEFGLTQDEIVQAIRAGTLQYREGSMYGNPWLRLLRREVEALVRRKHGDNYLKQRQSKAELARIDRELRRLKTQIARLEEKKSHLIASAERKRPKKF